MTWGASGDAAPAFARGVLGTAGYRCGGSVAGAGRDDSAFRTRKPTVIHVISRRRRTSV